MASRLILVKTCQRFRPRREACEATWAGKLRAEGVPVYFAEGGHDATLIDGNTIETASGDAYDDNSYKVREALRALIESQDFEHLFIVDDDAFVHPARWLAYTLESDFVGLATPTVPWPHGGCGVFVSRPLCQLYVRHVHRRCSGDDVLLWEILTNQFGVKMTNRPDLFTWEKNGARPAPDNAVIACHYVSSDEMYRLHDEAAREALTV